MSTTHRSSGGITVVTGAANGIGRAVANGLANEGHSLLLLDVDEAALRTLAESLTVPTTIAHCDVTDPESVEAALDSAGGPVSGLVQCAGIIRPATLLDTALDDWTLVLGVNLTGTFIVGRAVAHRMQDAGGGAIVNIASIGGITPGMRHGSYSASKAAVMTLTEQMALEWARLGIRVNAVAPGMIAAGMGEPINADPAERRRRDELIPLGRQGTADDVADAAVYLLSENAAYVSGHTLVVDGVLTKSVLAPRPFPT